MSKTYARGRNAVAECQRSGQKMRYRDLVEDGHIPGLLVHPDWWEPKHPQEIPVEVTDPVALYRPAPEISIEAGYGDPENLDGGTTPTTPTGAITGTLALAVGTFFDEFDRAGPTLGANWTSPSVLNRQVMEIQTVGSAQPGSLITADWCDAAYTGKTTQADQFAEVTLQSMDGASYERLLGAAVRVNPGTRQTYIGSLSGDDTADPQERYFTVEATQASGPANFLAFGLIDSGPAYVAGTKVYLEIVGTHIIFKWKEPGNNWKVLWEGDDGQYSSGSPGMVSYSYILPPEATQFESFRSGPAPYTQETQIVVNEAVTYTIGDWLLIELNDGSYFASRITTTANSPSFTVPFTTPFTGDAAADNNFYIEAG